ncbi:ATP-dependent helicase [Effusibacillus pohliae]|uniref:ATP-dependent helicase n=1 Tax=Effusibacillus pohliae TaxID=232270 RepID=UPI0003703C06|nr:ATP-dependent helicase [Effusibacillus pohliae]
MTREEKFFSDLGRSGIELNQSQKEAVAHVGGPLVVFAGPGSGKTTVLTCRASYLMQVAEVQPRQILIVTFTKAAAEEMQNRLAALPGIGPLKAQSCEAGTFHSIFLRILLRTYGNVPRLLNEWEQKQVIRELLRAEGQDGDEEAANDLLAKIGLCKNNLILPQQIRPKKKENVEFKRRYQQYEDWKKNHKRWDYDDILVECYRLLLSRQDVRQQYASKYRHLLVDEFQDTNYVQYEVLKILAADGELCIVGDDDQSIYRFRGARVDYLLSFQHEYPNAKTVVLGTNYRSVDPIIEAASSLITCNRKRHPKKLTGTGKQGELPVLEMPEDERSEAEQVLERIEQRIQCGDPVDDIAVLYRTHMQARALVDELVRRKIPFAIRDAEGSFYHQWQIRDILCYFKLATDPLDLDSLMQIINRPKRYLYPDAWMAHIATADLDSEQRSYLQALMKLPGLEAWKRRKLEDLAWDLKKISRLPPKDALRLIRKQVGYDQFLEEYAERTGQKKEHLFEPVDGLEQAVLPFESVTDFLLHVEAVSETLRNARKSERGIRLMTFHKAKGLEFRTVFLIGLVKGMVPHGKSLKEKDADASLEEERRLLYVGITRAKERVFLSAPQRYRGEPVERSPFLDEISVTARKI